MAPLMASLAPACISDNSYYFGTYGNHACFAVDLPENHPLPPEMSLCTLRSLIYTLSNDLFTLAGRAWQVLHFHRTHQYCGRCGTVMEQAHSELAKSCPACSLTSYPKVSPVVIMTIVRNNALLLARSPHFPEGMYSPLAGFIEPGETAEAAVSREIREESGISVTNIRYRASQPWPFPHSLMLGFTTDYDDGTLVIDTNELEDARWFPHEQLPKLPSSRSIARLLINCALKSCLT